jgi:hypothetical protein
MSLDFKTWRFSLAKVIKKNHVSITTYIRRTQKAQLEKIAIERDTTLAAFLRESLDEIIMKHNKDRAS